VIPPGFIQDLLARTDIADVVGQHVELKRGGANLMGLCPFHGEKSPSFSVSPGKQFYYCFGCGASGDAIRFLMEHLGLSFVEAVRDLAGRVGMQVPEEQVSPEEQQRRDTLRERRLSIGEALAKAGDFYRAQLRGSERAKDYLKGRGLTGEIARDFGLGYAPAGWRTLASVFARYDDPLLEEAGLVRRRDEGEDGERYDWFRDRVMFPIRAVSGEVIGFGGRVLDDSKPKYMNSPETPVFSKGRELYGLYEARGALRERGYALVVEGYMDVVALAQSGYGNAVATLGTACTAEHVQKLFRFTDSVVFSFDGDAAGRRAARRALEASLPHATDTRNVRFLFLPPEHDPDSYVREHGAAAFEACIAAAVPLSRQVVDSAAEDCALDTAEGRARMLANARPLWSALPDGVLKQQLLGELAAAARMEAADLRTHWTDAAAAPVRVPEAGAASPRPARRRPAPAGREVSSQLDRAVWLLLLRSDLWSRLDGESHDDLAAQAGPYDLFFACIERSVIEHGTVTSSALLEDLRAVAAQHPQGPTTLDRITRLLPPEPGTDLAQEFDVVLQRLRLKGIEAELTALFQSGTLSPQDQQRSLQLMGDQRRLKATLAKAPLPAG
jgi:DNA primase